jgi:hypothetical protein
MKIKSRGENDLPWQFYEDWGGIAHMDRLGYRFDDERIAQKLESERGTLSKTARKYIADRFIRARTRKPGRRPKSTEEKLRSRRDRAIEFVNAMDAALDKVGGDWERLPKKGLFSGTLQSAKQRYSRSKTIKDEWDRESLDIMRGWARVRGITLDELRADLRARSRNVP